MISSAGILAMLGRSLSRNRREGVGRCLCRRWLLVNGEQIHNAATSGFSADNVKRYESGRPSYSAETINSVLNTIRSKATYSSDPVFCEIGAGTGKFTVPFIQKVVNEYSKFDYLAIEPSEFVEHLRSLKLQSVRVENGVGESIPAPDNSVDAVMIAQAFHWMANLDCMQEVCRILRPGSPLVLVWNGYDSQVDWIRKLENDIIVPRYPKPPEVLVPRYQSMEWK